MRSVSLVLSLVVLCFQLCSARDTLKAGDNITQSQDSVNLISSNRTFELGFFSPSGSSNSVKSYLGIWYHGLEPRTVVWVANRDKPVLDSTGVLRIAEDGNLVVEAARSKRQYWSSELEGSTSENRTVRLLDSGNLVLTDGMSYMWQSFQNPTDTFLPGMNMTANLTLTCWRNETDPASGDFTVTVDITQNLEVKNQSQTFWRLERFDQELISMFMRLEEATWGSIRNISKDTIYPSQPYDKYSRLLMNHSGEIEFLNWTQEGWSKQWWWPLDKCNLSNLCGNFGVCNSNNWIHCKCLPGFIPKQDLSQGEIEGQGCVRKSTSCMGQDVMFWNFTNMKVSQPDITLLVGSEEDCKSLCLNNTNCPESHCKAYSYTTSTYNRGSVTCKIWTQELSDLLEDYDRGLDLSILVKKSDIEPTAKSCPPCGTYAIPYPLSTGPNCGDLMYNKFNCSNSTGQSILSFTMPNGISYQVDRIDEDTRKFYIQKDGSYSCSSMYTNDTPNFPFNVTGCLQDDQGVQISWQSAREPPCSNFIDCNIWPHSTCRAKDGGGTRCYCNSNYKWNDTILRCDQEDRSRNHSIHRIALILAVTLTGMAILLGIITFAIVWRKKTVHKLDRATTGIQESLYESERHVKSLIGLGSLEEKDIEGIEVPCYTFASILAATDNFSDSNKLGRGGYGPVYKGRFPGGQDIAVKRLSSVSTQGLQEFKNEVILIAKLQHRNLVRLRGYCIKGDEKILLYEYMPNKSLDSFIFDRTRALLLNWPMRFEIIVGIARGMLYLHQDSRLRVIHRDLKTSNVLLDEEMNPKISDFGLAKIFGGKETEASTERVVGTYGYMAPEYALDGLFSIKSDVFSFGVVLLEILSGKKNTGFYQSNKISSLLGYAWMLWTENRLLDLMDPSLGETYNENQILKCAHVGLLCIQDEPGDRPTMSNVLAMFEIEAISMPIPTQPTFFVNKRLSSSASSSSKPETSLHFDSSYQEGR